MSEDQFPPLADGPCKDLLRLMFPEVDPAEVDAMMRADLSGNTGAGGARKRPPFMLSGEFIVDPELMLPYGCWLTRDGRIVLFNRAFNPIMTRSPAGWISPEGPDERIEGVVEERLFWTDDAHPCRHEDAVRRMARVLRSWWHGEALIPSADGRRIEVVRQER